MSQYTDTMNRHYGRPDLGGAILAALQKAGKDIDALTLDDLTPFSEFHIGGQAKTLELARLVGLGPDMYVLDVGSGIGGPARTLAHHFSCRVTGLDFIEEFCNTATMLTQRVGLDALVDFQQGNALAMPFDDEQFDVVWTQHATMNIDDKRRLYGEMHRVLAPGGQLVFYEFFAGPGGPLHLPVPWASDPTINSLISPEAARELLTQIGFTEVLWQDVTAWAFEVAAQRMTGPPSPLRGGYFMFAPGTDIQTMLATQQRTLEEHRQLVIQGIYKRSA